MGTTANTQFLRRTSIFFFVLALVWDLFAAGPFTVFIDVLKTAPASCFVFLSCLFLSLDHQRTKTLIPEIKTNRLALLLFLVFFFSVFPSSLFRLGYDRFYLSCVSIQCIVISLYVFAMAKEETVFVQTIITVFVTSLGILAILGLLEQFGIILWNWNGGFQQIATLFMNPNLYSGILILLLPFAGVGVLLAKKKSIRLAYLLIFCLGFFNLILAQSRASIIGFFIAILLCAVLYALHLSGNGPKTLLYVSIFFFGFFALFIAGLLVLPQLREKFLFPFSFSGQSRLGAYQIALNLWMKSPLTVLFGNGLGSFPELYFTAKPPFYRAQPFMETWDATHDEVLERLVDGGVLELAAFVILMLFLIRSCTVAVRNQSLPRNERILSLGCLGAIVASILDSLLSTNSRVSFIQILFAVVAGLAVRLTPPVSMATRLERPWTETIVVFLALIFVPLVLCIPQGARLVAELNMAKAVDSTLTSDEQEIYLQKARSADPSSIYPVYLEAYHLFSTGRYSQCIETSQLVQQHISNFKDVKFLQGAAAVGLNDLPAAKVYLDEYLARDQYEEKAEKYSIFINYRLGDLNSAMARLQESVEGDFVSNETPSRYRVVFSDSEITRRVGDRLTIGNPTMLRSLATIFTSPVSRIAVYFFRLDYLIGTIYEQAGLRALAEKRYRSAEVNFRDASSSSVSDSLPLTEKWLGYSIDSSLRHSMIGRALSILEEEIQEKATKGNTSNEIESLRAYLHYSLDKKKQERLTSLLAKSWRFKELRVFQFASLPRNSP